MRDELHVAALSGGRTIPSARFRVGQFVSPLARAGIRFEWRPARVTGYPPARRWLRPVWLPLAVLARLPDVIASRQADVTFVSKSFISTLATLEFAAKRPRVWDVDDAIWLRSRGGSAVRLARSMDLIIAGNAYLADWLGRHGVPVEILPTAVDTDRFKPVLRQNEDREGLSMGWTGSSSNFEHLYRIEEALADVLRSRPHARLRICADCRPRFRRLAPDRVDFVPWQSEAEVAFINSLDVGLMPLDDNAWTRGKCAYKMLLYLACGVPAVVSPVGMNREVLAAGEIGKAAAANGEWRRALGDLLDDRERRQALGANGRTLVEQQYSVRCLAPRLAAMLRKVAGLRGDP